MKNSKQIYYRDSINKKTYSVPEDKQKLLEIYKYRYSVVASLAVLMGWFVKNYIIIIAFFIILALFTEFVYRARFLKKLKVVPERDVPVEVKEIKKESLYLNIVLYSVFGVLLAYLALYETEEGLSKWLLLAVAAASIMLGIRYIVEAFSNTKK